MFTERDMYLLLVISYSNFHRMLMDPVGKKAFAINFTKVPVVDNNKRLL